MRISKVVPWIDYESLGSVCQVFRLRSSKGRFGYADEVFDRLAREASIMSVSFLGGGEAWVLARRGGERGKPEAALRSAISGRRDLAFSVQRDLRAVDSRVLAQLCLAAVAGTGALDESSNLCGRLFVVSLGRPHTEYFKGGFDPKAIHALEISVSPRMELELKVATFTSCAARRFKRERPRFELVDGRYLRRALSYKDPNDKALFALGAIRDGERYGKFAFMDASGPAEFARSKLGILRSVFVCLDELFEGAVRLEFEEAEEGESLYFSKSDRAERLTAVARQLEQKDLCVCDLTGELGDAAQSVALTVEDVIGHEARVVEKPKAGAANLLIVHGVSHYEDSKGDPYGNAPIGTLTQHLTPESGFTPTVVAVALKELTIKRDVAEGRMALLPWKWGSWSFARRTECDEDAFAFLDVSPDGSMVFEGPASAIEASVRHQALVEVLLASEEAEFAIKGPEGDINAIGRTELFGVPDFERVWRDLMVRRPDRVLKPNGQAMKHAIGKGKADRELYFADAIDAASCRTVDGKTYYRAGLRGYNMQFSATHKASLLREVIPWGDSRPLTDELLPMLDVDMVRWGESTVVPFPLKYLREWVAMKERL